MRCNAAGSVVLVSGDGPAVGSYILAGSCESCFRSHLKHWVGVLVRSCELFGKPIDNLISDCKRGGCSG